MTEAKAWTKLAKWFAADIGREFICNALSAPHLRGLKFLDSKMAETMHARIKVHMMYLDLSAGSTLDVSEDGTFWQNHKSSSARVMFCLFMAMECEEEEATATP